MYQKVVAEYYYNSFNNGSGREIEMSVRFMWVYVFGGLTGGALAGLWKHMNTKVEMGLGGIACHPALKDVYEEEQKAK